MYLCEQCGKEVYETFGSGRFCSRSCSNKYNALHQSLEAKARKVEKGKKNLVHKGRQKKTLVLENRNKEDEVKIYTCICGKEFNNRRSFGGHKCSCKIYNNWSDDEYKEYVRKCHIHTHRIKVEDVLSNKVFCQTNSLKWKLIEEGYKKYVCERCGLTEWLGNPIPIELHHKDWNKNNNNLDNIEILCPNCHAFTDNYRWKGRKDK